MASRKFNILLVSVLTAGAASLGCNQVQADRSTPSEQVQAAPVDQQQAQSSPTTQLREPDVVYVPTPQNVVDQMLAIANVNEKDVLYDLGSGDGRIPITAAQRFGIQATGIDINPERIREANENAQKAGVTDRVKFLNQDLFTSQFSDATVVTLYLLPELNVKLRPQLFQQLKPGTRIVSHDFAMGDWKPDRVVQVEGPSRTHTVYLWTIPEKVPANLQSETSK
ncbi:MAG TPA: class I SAM-dependent methyltransferase [Leptolyngbyaceae cyanobacterium M33_DOE_097]|uniref:Class I SAM-dependent methyltransferase n=1 Tax=Oscillatoriales cyanobacterium SpSt-418 TaxID=2282169 RepID=A0A7C3PD09_9CYAN|nr:class I SAM-dependent methyltransferase [Leptolyngbyaceae cyanobacterium M33_DOE_097]